MKTNAVILIVSTTLVLLGSLVMATGVDKGDVCRTIMGNAYYMGGCVLILMGRHK